MIGAFLLSKARSGDHADTSAVKELNAEKCVGLHALLRRGSNGLGGQVDLRIEVGCFRAGFRPRAKRRA